MPLFIILFIILFTCSMCDLYLWMGFLFCICNILYTNSLHTKHLWNVNNCNIIISKLKIEPETCLSGSYRTFSTGKSFLHSGNGEETQKVPQDYSIYKHVHYIQAGSFGWVKRVIPQIKDTVLSHVSSHLFSWSVPEEGWLSHGWLWPLTFLWRGQQRRQQSPESHYYVSELQHVHTCRQHIIYSFSVYHISLVSIQLL